MCVIFNYILLLKRSCSVWLLGRLHTCLVMPMTLMVYKWLKTFCSRMQRWSVASQRMWLISTSAPSDSGVLTTHSRSIQLRTSLGASSCDDCHSSCLHDDDDDDDMTILMCAQKLTDASLICMCPQHSVPCYCQPVGICDFVAAVFRLLLTAVQKQLYGLKYRDSRKPKEHCVNWRNGDLRKEWPFRGGNAAYFTSCGST